MAANHPLIRFFLTATLALVLTGAIGAHADIVPNKAGEPRTKDGQSLPHSMHAPGDEAAINALFDKLKMAQTTELAQPIANDIWRLWLRSGSDTVDLLITRVQLLMREREFDQALELLDTVVEIAPHYAEGWNKRATVFYMKGDFRQSIADVRQVLALEPRHFGALSGLGSMLREVGNPASALGAFRAALKVHPFLAGAARAIEELTDEVEGRKI